LRASSLSHARIVSLLNQHFVPVYARNGDYRPSDADKAAGAKVVPPAEKAEYDRIYHEAVRARLSTGTVHVYVLDPAGHPIDSLHVAEATKPDRMLAMLERAIARLKVKPGEPLIKPCCQSKARAAGPDYLVVHLTARYLARQGDDYVRQQPVLGTERSGQWASLPSEDWLVLPRAEWAKLLPAGEVRVGRSWDWDRAVAARLLTHFYPPTENTNNATNRIDDQAMKATVVSIRDGLARARVEGRLRMKHPFYHRDTDEFAEADVVGFLEFEPRPLKVRSLRLVTDRATYGSATSRHPFGVAVRLVP
jgi:hypothetical protein